jgi:hypothetical protein
MEKVFVPEEWLAKAKKYGEQRVALNGGNDSAGYRHDGKLPLSNLTANRLAVVGEIGALLYFGLDPNDTVFVVERSAANYKALRANADLMVGGRKVEVRNAVRRTSPIPIRPKDVAADAVVVQTMVEMDGGKPTGWVYFLGWADAKADYQHAANKRHGVAYKAIKRDMADLGGLL